MLHGRQPPQQEAGGRTCWLGTALTVRRIKRGSQLPAWKGGGGCPATSAFSPVGRG